MLLSFKIESGAAAHVKNSEDFSCDARRVDTAAFAIAEEQSKKRGRGRSSADFQTPFDAMKK